MRKGIALATGVVLLSSMAWAGAKDKSQNTLLDRTGAGIIDNATAKTKIKSKGCTTQIQAKDVNLPDEAIVICLLEADVLGIGGNSLIVAGEVKKNKLKIKADISQVSILSQACGSVIADSYNGTATCYLDDPTFRSDSTGAGTWRDNCAAAGMPLTSGAPGTTLLKVNDTVPVVIGLCQGTTEGDRIVPPASTEWAVTGQRTQLDN